MARTLAKARPALGLVLALLAAVLLAAAVDASPAAAVRSSTHNRRLKQDKCDQCNSCACDANCDCIDTPPNKCDQCNSCTCDANCDCIDGSSTTPTGNKCDQCNSCTCDANCDCIDEGSSPLPPVDACAICQTCACDNNCVCANDGGTTKPATTTDLSISGRNIALGKGVTARQVVELAWGVCDNKSCNPDPIEMPMELWAKGSEEQDWSMCNQAGDGYYTGGTCTVRFQGTTGSWDVRNALVELLVTAADASQQQALPGVQQQRCRCQPPFCGRTDEPANVAMPSFMKATRGVDVGGGEKAQAGEISLTVDCQFDPRGENVEWWCVAAGLGATIAGAISGGAGAALGVVATVCSL